jgi:hypothetical protein
MFKKGDLVYHCVFEEDRGVVVEEVADPDSHLFHYRIWWNDNTYSVEPSRDIQLVESK